MGFGSKKDEENVYSIGQEVRRERKPSKEDLATTQAAPQALPVKEYKGVASYLADEHMPETVDGVSSPANARGMKETVVNLNQPGNAPVRPDWMAPQGAGWAPPGWGPGGGPARDVTDPASPQQARPQFSDDIEALMVQMHSMAGSPGGSGGGGDVRMVNMLEDALRVERKRNISAEARAQSYELELRKVRDSERAAAVEAASLKAKLEGMQASFERAEKDRQALQQALLARK